MFLAILPLLPVPSQDEPVALPVGLFIFIKCVTGRKQDTPAFIALLLPFDLCYLDTFTCTFFCDGGLHESISCYFERA